MKTNSEIIEMKGEQVTFELRMASGEIERICKNSRAFCDYFKAYDRPEENPYYIMEAETRLRQAIEKGLVQSRINLGLVESYRIYSVKKGVHFIEKTTRKYWYGTFTEFRYQGFELREIKDGR